MVLTNAEDVGYILRLAVAGYKGLSIEAVKSLQLPSRGDALGHRLRRARRREEDAV